MYNELLKLVAARPLHPFRVHLSSGEHVDIVRPNQAVPTKNAFVIGIIDHFRHIPLASITRVELLGESDAPKQTGQA